MQAPKQNKPKRKRISTKVQPAESLSNTSGNKVVIGRLIYEKIDTVKKEK
ncbi:hypothetical protein J7E50_02520 [Pedobacter sp. ISL-68]|nr:MULTISPECIES: hypothetical protein [unclassified Pedobacter]MBT2560095.1 hypothetical protein [Pedobacter sp. ISL-64]MBT2589074.1 hypothetical protein [Pedobacter sp. ISL-68]